MTSAVVGSRRDGLRFRKSREWKRLLTRFARSLRPSPSRPVYTPRRRAMQCEGIKKDGTRCSKTPMGHEAWARHVGDIVADASMEGRLCFWRAVGGYEAMSSRGGKASVSARHRRKERTAAAAAQGYTYEQLIEVVAPALVAVIEEPGWPRVPDWNARLSAVALLLEMMPDWYRDSPQQMRELLDRILPDAVADARLTPERAYIALAQEKHRLRERGDDLSRLGGGS